MYSQVAGHKCQDAGRRGARLALVQKKRRPPRFALNSLMVTGSAGPGDHLGPTCTHRQGLHAPKETDNVRLGLLT